MRNYPKNLISGWAGGTGIAGIGGSGATLLFKKLGIEIYYVYLFLPIFYLIYFISFFTIDKLYRSYLAKIAEERNEGIDDHLIDTKATDMNDYTNNKALSFENFKIGVYQAKWYVFNIAAVISIINIL